MKLEILENLIYSLILLTIFGLMNHIATLPGVFISGCADNDCKAYCVVGESGCEIDFSIRSIFDGLGSLFILLIAFLLIYLEVWLARGGMKTLMRLIINKK